MSKKEKIYLNGIPVFRTEVGDDTVKYVLFEDDETRSSVININLSRSASIEREREYGLICQEIFGMFERSNKGDTSIKVRVEAYEQDRRNMEWIFKPGQEEIGVYVG